MPLNLDNIDYDSLSALQDVDTTGQVKSTVSEAMKTNPDSMAKQKNLSESTGVPMFAIPGAEAELETDIKLKQIDFDKLQQNSPATHSMLGNYDDAVVLHDEIGGLEKAESAIKSVRDWGAYTGESFKRGNKIVRQSEIGLDRMWAQLGVGDPVSDETLEELRSIEAEVSHELNPDYGYLVGAIPTAAEQLPIMWEILKGGITGASGGALVGGATGGVVGAATGPGAVATATTGAVWGGKWGGRAGVAKQSFDLESGSAFNEFSALTDEQGNTLDPQLAAQGAVVVGTINAGLEFASFMALGRTVTPAMRAILRNKVKQSLMTETGREVMGRIAARYAEAVAAEGVTEFTQEMSNLIGGEFLKMMDDNSFTDQDIDKAFDNVVEGLPRALEAGVKGTQAALVFGAPGTIATTVTEYNTRRKELADNKGQQLDSINDAVSQLKVKERSKETFKQFVEKADGDNNTTVFIDGVQSSLYLQSKTQEEINADPALKLLQEQVREAHALQTDVQVKVADFAADIAGTDHYTALREHMTLDPELPTPFRVEQEQVETENYIKTLMTEAEQNTSQYVESQAIFESVKDQLTDTGMVDPRYASVMSQLVPAYFSVLSQRTGKPIEQLYRERGFTIEGPQTGRMDEVSRPEITPEQVQARIVPTEDRRVETVTVQSERRADDRRVDSERRAAFDAMSDEDKYKALYTDQLTGLDNRRAFEEDTGKYPFLASIDADSLGATNENLGHSTGDALLKTIANSLSESGLKAYHISGDEFYLAGESQEQLEQALTQAQAGLQGKRIGSDRGTLTSPVFTYGVGQDKDAADKVMEATKVEREKAGERVPKGVLPKNIELSNQEVIDEFYKAFTEAKESNPNGAAVHVWPKDDYAKVDLFLYDEGKAGFAITRQGDLISVFKHPDSTMKGALDIMVPEAIRQGATRLDAFEGFLTKQYAKYGFEEVGRAPFDPEQAPADWDTETMGTPDVVFMELSDESRKQSTATTEAESVQQPSRIRRGTRLLEQQDRQDTRPGREKDGSLRNLPRDIPGFKPRHNKRIAKVAEQYMKEAGLEYNPPDVYVPVNVARAERIAAEFEKMPHNPQNPEVAAAYDALFEETIAQYKFILKAGLKVEFITERDNNGDLIDPYDKSPRLAVEDIANNNHMWVFSTRDGFGTDDTFNPVDNPLLRDTEFTDANGIPMLANDVFRVVHDYFGHAKEGVGFRAAGEENAWRAHSSMYSPLARKAMTTETRGQNSWLNYGPYGEHNRTARTKDTKFADQKIGLLPDWAIEEGAGDSDVLFQKESQYDIPRPLGLYSGALKTVLTLKLPQWQTSKKDKKAVQPKIDSLTQKRQELRDELNRLDAEFRVGMDELRSKEATPAEVNDYINNSYDGTPIEKQIRDIDREISELKRGLENPLAKGADVWAKIKSEGVKKEELEWSGLEEFLTVDPDAKFSRDDVAQFINQNGVNIVEVVAGVADQEEDIDQFNWQETIDEYEGNWEHRIEDFMYDFDRYDELDEFEYWLDQDAFEAKVREWMDEHPDDAEVKEFRQKEELLDTMQKRFWKLSNQMFGDELLPSGWEEPRQDEFDFKDFSEWSTAIADLETEIEDTKNKLFLDIGTDKNGIRDWVEAQANEVAKQEYMDDPYVSFTDSDYEGVEIYGSNDLGYRGSINGREVFSNVYGFHEAEIQMLDALREDGSVADENVAKWSDFVMPGRHTNYRELKLTLPEIEGDFYNEMHFPDRNIVAFLRVDDRQLHDYSPAIPSEDGRSYKNTKNTYFIDEFQSDWHQQGRQDGYQTGQDAGILEQQSNAERYGVPDAPFKGDAWIALGLKRALVDAAEKGYEAIGWPNSQTLVDRWHEKYRKLYETTYDMKMPSIVKKLTKQKAVEFNLAGDIIEPTIDINDYKKNATVQYNDVDKKYDVIYQDRVIFAGFDTEEQAQASIDNEQQSSFEGDKEEGYWIIPITPEMRESIKAKGFPLFQDTKGFYDPDQSIIRLTEAADLSTFLHEFAHFMLENERRYNGDFMPAINSWFDRIAPEVAKEARQENDQVTDEDVRNYTKYNTTGDTAKDKAIQRATHEQFARAWEQYLMEGKAPSIELRNVFRAIARWMTQLYQRIRGQINPNLDNEMRQVFDRLIATEEQIEMAAAREKFAPMFTDAAMAGMTEEEFQKYKERTAKIKDHAAETLRDKLIKEITRAQQEWWRQEKADVADDERDKLKNEPIYLAADRLKNGDIKLDHATVKEMVGETRTDKKGRDSFVIPKTLTGMTAKGQAGVHPDEAAAFFGFNSGEELLHTLMATPKIEDAADAAAEQVMRQRHGDIMNDGTIEQLADEALQNEEKAKLLLEEVKVLRRGVNQSTIDRGVIEALAAENIGKLSFREIFPEKYRRAEIRAAQEAAAALAKGDKQGAAQAKTRQLLNHFLAREATKAKTETTSIVDFMARYGKKPIRERILKAENGYMEQIDKIMHRFEFRKSATLKGVDRVNEGLKQWMDKRNSEHGDSLVLSPAVLDESYVTHWKNIKFSDLQGIRDSVKNIEHVARYIDKIKVLQEKKDFKALVEEIVDHLGKQPTVHKPQRTSVVDGKKNGRWAMAQMSKMPWVASWLDGGERTGLMHDILMTPMNEAYDQEVQLWRETGKPVLEAIENRSKEDRKRHGKKLYIPEIKDENNDGMLFGHQVLAAALNTGNQGNLRKMLLGEGWANPDNDAEISIDNPKLQAVLTHMTKADWDLVQQIWDQMDKLYPQLAEVHRRTTGLTPPKVQATTVPTPFGEYRGGYYPVKYDPNRSFRAEQNEDRLNAETESMFAGGASLQAQVNTGATEERTGYYAPVRLSLDVVPNHFQETIHYIAFHDAVRQTNKIIRNKQVAEAIKKVLGPEEYSQFKPWLNDIAKDGREAPTKTFIDQAMGKLRFGVTLGVMGFKASTGLMQLLGLTNTAGEVGSKHLLKSFRMILGSPKDIRDAWDFAVENSKVMSHRAETMDREIRSAMKKIEGKHGLLPAAQETSMKHIALIQTYMVDLPTWYAAYSKGIEEWGDEARAFRYADWAVENIQGSGATKDMAPLMRSQGEIHRTFTMFMTFFSSLWNTERDLARGARSGRYSVTSVAAKAMWFFMVPTVLEALMRGELGDDDDDKELQKLLLTSATYPIQSVPFVRDIANGVFSGYSYNITPIASLLEQATRTVPEIATRGFTDEEITKAQWKGGSKFIGAAVGIPGINQAWATGEHLYDVIEEGEDLSVRGLIYGPKR